MFKKGSFEIGATVYPVAIKVQDLWGCMWSLSLPPWMERSRRRWRKELMSPSAGWSSPVEQPGLGWYGPNARGGECNIVHNPLKGPSYIWTKNSQIPAHTSPPPPDSGNGKPHISFMYFPHFLHKPSWNIRYSTWRGGLLQWVRVVAAQLDLWRGEDGWVQMCHQYWRKKQLHCFGL